MEFKKAKCTFVKKDHHVKNKTFTNFSQHMPSYIPLYFPKLKMKNLGDGINQF